MKKNWEQFIGCQCYYTEDAKLHILPGRAFREDRGGIGIAMIVRVDSKYIYYLSADSRWEYFVPKKYVKYPTWVD